MQVSLLLAAAFVVGCSAIDLGSLEPTPTGEVSCQKLATFYEGTFAPTSGYGMPFKAQFEFKIDVNPQTKKITTQRKWNKSYSNSDLRFWLSNYNSRFCYPHETECSIAFDESAKSFRFCVGKDPENSPWSRYMMVIPYGSFDNKFTLENAVGQCSKTIKGNKPYNVDQTKFQACFCCGDKYNPDPSLGCPKNPWA